MNNCKKYIDYMYDKLDGTLDFAKEKELQNHIENCKECATEYRFINAISFELQNEEIIPLPEKFDMELRQKLVLINQNKKKRFLAKFPYFNRVATAVAAIALMVFAYSNISYAPINDRTYNDDSQNLVVASKNPTATAEPTSEIEVPSVIVDEQLKDKPTNKSNKTQVVTPTSTPEAIAVAPTENPSAQIENVVIPTTPAPTPKVEVEVQTGGGNVNEHKPTEKPANASVLKSGKSTYSFEINVTVDKTDELKNEISKIAPYEEIYDNTLQIENKYYKDVKKLIEETPKKSATYMTKDKDSDVFIVVITKELN